ncbi:MAG: AMP-binding protein, partial [Acidimicrobiia bacterium]|nr:AMP-binding protein [Acidimicrobiia bacterium]
EHPADSIALISRGRATTYGELRDDVDHLRGGFASLGLQRGDRIALLCSNGPHFAICYLAALGLGAVVVPLNPLSPSPELEREIGDVDAKVVVIEKLSAATWANVDRALTPTVTTVVTADHDAGADEVAIAELLRVAPVSRVDVHDDHLAALMFTSGTAGAPRAAMLSHCNLMASIEQTLNVQDRLRPDDIVYGVLPLFHIFGLNVVLGMSLYAGSAVMLVQRFDPTTAADSIRERGVTIVPGVPAMWTAFAHFDELADNSFASVRLALSGASRLSASVFEKMRDRFDLEISEGYGLTEASPTVTTSSGIPVRAGSVGRALEGVEVRLVNVNGEALVGDVGEVWVRGDNVFLGYFGDADATDAVLDADGWLRTGDMAITDDDGYLYLVDRSKDLIIVSGFNVFPAEVEEVLALHPDVVDVGVIGVPHPHTGEAVKAFVVAADGSDVDEETLIEHSLDQLARYKCPSKILFVRDLPRNASGKLIRRQLDDIMAIS